MQLKRLIVGKGKTSKPGDSEEWSKEYYEIEASIENSAELEATKATAVKSQSTEIFILQSSKILTSYTNYSAKTLVSCS